MGYLKERKKKSIIRYFKGKYDDDITRIRCVMLLFHPFRNEVLEVHNNERILEKYKECKEMVEEEQSLFEPNPEFIGFLENIEQENIEEDEEQQEQLDNDFVEEDTTKPEEVQDLAQITSVPLQPFLCTRYTSLIFFHYYEPLVLY